MFSLFSKRINVQQIQRGQQLDKAIAKTVDDFMDKRLQNPPRKALVGIYLVFFEDDDYIYWGKAFFQWLFSSKRVVHELYKTTKADAIEQYPEYQQDFYSVNIKKAIEEAVYAYENLQDGVHFHHFDYRKPPFIEIKEDEFRIKIYANINYTSAPYQDIEGEAPLAQDGLSNYTIRLKRDDLKLLEIKTF